MMTILHCFGIMDCGGAETMLMNIYRKIDRNKFRFYFLVHNQQPGFYDEEIKQLGGEIFFIPSIGTCGLSNYTKNLKNKISEIQSPIDVVHIHMDWQGGYIARAFSLAGIKNIIVHSHAQEYRYKGIVKKISVLISKLLIKCYASELFACSQSAAKALFGSSPVSIINNAIDVEKFKNVSSEIRGTIRRELGVDSGDKLFIHVGSFSQNKNQLFLIDLFFELVRTKSHYKLLLIGTGGKYYEQAKEKIKELSLEKEILQIGVRDNIQDYMVASDMFLFPSFREGFGMVAVEAQASGLPCIISDTIPNSVDMELGLIKALPLSDFEQWKNYLVSDLKKETDKNHISQQLKKHGMDIQEQVLFIEKKYMKYKQ